MVALDAASIHCILYESHLPSLHHRTERIFHTHSDVPLQHSKEYLKVRGHNNITTITIIAPHSVVHTAPGLDTRHQSLLGMLTVPSEDEFESVTHPAPRANWTMISPHSTIETTAEPDLMHENENKSDDLQ